jgi:hypothetical protein
MQGSHFDGRIHQIRTNCIQGCIFSVRRGVLCAFLLKCSRGFAHEYKWHGTTNLLAALNVATGQVKAKCFSTKRREEFLHFLDSITTSHAGKEIHPILENLAYISSSPTTLGTSEILTSTSILLPGSIKSKSG